MFYTKYGLIAFYLSHMFPPEASTVIVKHLKRLNEFELSKDFYIKNCNLSKYIPYQYILNTCLHCRLSSFPPNVIYSSIHKNKNHRILMSELNRVFSRNFENTSKMLTYICNRDRIFDFYNDEKRGFIKIGYRFIFQSNEKTLKVEEVDDILKKVIEIIISDDEIDVPGYK